MDQFQTSLDENVKEKRMLWTEEPTCIQYIALNPKLSE
jgi:hypothetical protein